ncbi:hypothetical protein EYS42_08235 [Aquabacterium lacunae]|jgi:uncharacterized membrane protein|uniref:Uncharacterized protein n=1 Tax=Aquabacterium lacunae TaxID=2528630 RepID=A0A4Q9H407_9BURK|nr:hypothetical protein [Aquabacterium lacunae]TBO31226.1 hypothetical protein EYS42_08235 [Aquabacterium lacunae]
MVALLRFLVLGLVLAFVFCVIMGRLTGQPVWRERGMNVLKWGVVLAMIAFGGFILRRAALFM